MKKPLLFGLLLLWAANTFSQVQDLSFLSIPADLLRNAYAVKRYEVMEVNIQSPGRALRRHKYAITILNEKGDDFADFSAYYNKFNTIIEIEGRLLDAFGKELKKVKKKDIADQSAEQGSEVTDTRFKNHNFYYKSYPYTIEYAVDVEVNGMFTLPTWFPQFSPFLSVQNSTMVVQMPQSYELRHKSYNLEVSPVVSTAGGLRKMEWTISNLKSRKPEPFMPSWYRLAPKLALAPVDFEIDGYRGKMSSWKDFGSFLHQLTVNRDALPPAMLQKVRELTQGITDPYKKIDVLYRYLQNNTRYISIQLGIGGWQTLPAENVARNGYGDCKALTNFMAAMLKEAGITGRHVVINSGNDGLFTDASFVSNQFDHMILCVPFAKDTVWLECTDNTMPAGYLGSFTYNRPALMIAETGGTLVYTPHYRKQENKRVRMVDAVIQDNGDLKARAQTLYTGLQQDNLLDLTKKASRDEVLKFLRNRFDMPTYDIADYQYQTHEARVPGLTEILDISSFAYAQFSGKRLFVSPNILSKSGIKLQIDSIRAFDVELSYDYFDTDTVHIKVPAGYEPENLPKPVDVVSPFGEYHASVQFSNDMIIYTRIIQQNAGRYAPAQYGDLVAFYQTIAKADRARVVLRKKEE